MCEDVCGRVYVRLSAIHSAISQCFTYKDEFNEKQRERKNRDIKITHSNETTTKQKKNNVEIRLFHVPTEHARDT